MAQPRLPCSKPSTVSHKIGTPGGGENGSVLILRIAAAGVGGFAEGNLGRRRR